GGGGGGLWGGGGEVGGGGKAVSRKMDLVDIQRPPFDQRTERFAAAFSFAGCDRDGRAVTEPDVAVDVVRAQRFLEPFDALFGERLGAAECRTRVPDAAGVNQQRGVVTQAFPGAPNELAVERLALPHRLPSEFDRGVTCGGPFAGDVPRRSAVAAEQDRGICADPFVRLASQQAMNRLTEVLSLEVPEGHIDRGHGGDRDSLASEVQ